MTQTGLAKAIAGLKPVSSNAQGKARQDRLERTFATFQLVDRQVVAAAQSRDFERVERTVNLADQTVRSVTGKRMLVLTVGVLPLVDLAEALGYESAPDACFMVIVHGAERRLALVVERLVGQRELVTRPLPAEVGSQSCLSGGVVVSDGAISLIVDCDALAEAGGAGHGAATPSDLAHAA